MPRNNSDRESIASSSCHVDAISIGAPRVASTGGVSCGSGSSCVSANTCRARADPLAHASRRLQFLQGRLKHLLSLSSVEQTKAFYYGSSGALHWTQRLMLRLWSYLLSQARDRHEITSRSPRDRREIAATAPSYLIDAEQLPLHTCRRWTTCPTSTSRRSSISSTCS